MLLSGKTAIVTGASRGIGEAIAKRFAKEGANVFALARDKSALNRIYKNTSIIPVPCDIGKEKEVKASFKFIKNKSGEKVDILINVAGIAEPYATIFQNNFTEWKKVFETNVFGTFLMIKHVLPLMCKSCNGKIVNFYGGSDGPLPGFSAYNASKAAVARLTETIAKEIKSSWIDINIIAPGPVKTKLFTKMFSQSRNLPPATIEMEKPVSLVLFLASRQSDGLSGKFISAVWDDWKKIPENLKHIMTDHDIFTLRRKKEGL